MTQDSNARINYDEPQTKPPPLLEVGVLAWMRQNLFSSTFDAILTIGSILFVISLIVSFLNWAIGWANWYVIINNLRLFLLGRIDPEVEWRIAITVLLVAFLIGLSITAWARRAARTLALVGAGTVLFMAVAPFLINSVIPAPSSNLVAGNVDVIDRADTLTPQTELAFIAAEGEEVRIAFNDAAIENDTALSGLSGFSDRVSAALANSAASGLERQKQIRTLIDQLASGTLTANQVDRVLGDIRVLKRTGPELDEDQDARVDMIIEEIQAKGFDKSKLPALTDEILSLLVNPEMNEVYELNTVSVDIAILDGQTLEPVASGTLEPGGDAFTVTIPANGWYVLQKTISDGSEGVALLTVDNVDPLLERASSTGQAEYMRFTDSLRVTAPRPVIDGEGVSMVSVTDNQFRDRRTFSTYLRHFFSPFVRQVERLALPTILVVIWGYAAGFVLAHWRGDRTRFDSLSAKSVLLMLGLAPAIPVVLYATLIDGQWGVTLASTASDFIVIVIKVVLLALSLGIAAQVSGWLKQANVGEEAQKPIDSLVLSFWGIFPAVMMLLAGGVPNFSGADIGTIAGGVIWLVIMYLIGVNFKHNIVGFGMVVGGLFLALLLPLIPLFSWPDVDVASEVFNPLLLWLALAVGGTAAAYVGHQLRHSFSFRFQQIGVMALVVLWAAVLFGTAPLLAELTRRGVSISVSPDVAAPLAYALWLGLMFFIGQTRWNFTWVTGGLMLLSVQWFFLNDVTVWAGVTNYKWFNLFGVSLLDLAWLFIGLQMIGRGVESHRDAQEAGTGLARFGMSALVGAIVAYALVMLIVPQLIVGADNAGLLIANRGDLFPGNDTRKWGGLMLTMQLTVVGIVASFPIGILLALGRRSNLPVVRWVCVTYIELVRGVPLITVLFMAQLLVPLVNPALANVDGVTRAMIGITLFSAAYLAENVRGGLQSIPPGQEEAAKAVGLGNWQVTYFIMLPQALRAVIPALVGQFISLFKDTSLVAIVGLIDLTGIAQSVVAQAEYIGRRRETFLFVAIIYFIFSYIISYISRRIEASGSGAAAAARRI